MRRFLLPAMLLFAAAAMAEPLTMQAIQTRSNKQVEKDLPDSHPAAYFAYASKLFAARRQDDAVNWYYIGQIRYRHYLLANPNLDPAGDPAQYEQIKKGLGGIIVKWAGSDIDRWLRSMEAALSWDNSQPNSFTSKETFATQWQQAREELVKYRHDIDANREQIKQDRAAQGLRERDSGG